MLCVLCFVGYLLRLISRSEFFFVFCLPQLCLENRRNLGVWIEGELWVLPNKYNMCRVWTVVSMLPLWLTCFSRIECLCPCRCQPHIMSLLLELGLETHPQHIDGRKVQQLAGPVISHYMGDLPSLSVFALLDLHRSLSKVNECHAKRLNEKMVCKMEPSYNEVSYSPRWNSALDKVLVCFLQPVNHEAMLWTILYILYIVLPCILDWWTL